MSAAARRSRCCAPSSSTTCSAATRSCSTARASPNGSATAIVMVTGAGGSIGAELCRQIARFRPARLVLFDISEAALYEIKTTLVDAFPQLRCRLGRRRRQARVARRRDARARRTGRDLPRGRLQARAADGGDELLAGGAQQRVRHVGAGARGGRGEGREIRARLDRQGRQSDVRDGRDEARRRAGLPEPAGWRNAVRHRALRQRVRQRRQRDPAFRRADRARRPGDGDASGHHAVLHVAVRGDAVAAAGGSPGQGRRDPRCSTWASRCASSISRAT